MPTKSNDTYFAQAVGELTQANKTMASSLQGIESNLKTLNDHNILHAERSVKNQETILSKLKTMTDKYWWLILVLIAVVLIITGYPKLASMFV